MLNEQDDSLSILKKMKLKEGEVLSRNLKSFAINQENKEIYNDWAHSQDSVLKNDGEEAYDSLNETFQIFMKR